MSPTVARLQRSVASYLRRFGPPDRIAYGEQKWRPIGSTQKAGWLAVGSHLPHPRAANDADRSAPYSNRCLPLPHAFTLLGIRDLVAHGIPDCIRYVNLPPITDIA